MKAKSRNLVNGGIFTVVLLLAASFVLPHLVFPQPPRLTAEVYEALFPYQGHYANLENGARVHYVDEGDRRPVTAFPRDLTRATAYLPEDGDFLKIRSLLNRLCLDPDTFIVPALS